MTTRRLLLLLVLMLGLPGSAVAQPAVFLVRDAERADTGSGAAPAMAGAPAADPDLSEAGRARARLHDRPTLAPRVTTNSSSCSNVSPIPSVLPEAMAPSRASFEG